MVIRTACSRHELKETVEAQTFTFFVTSVPSLFIALMPLKSIIAL